MTKSYHSGLNSASVYRPMFKLLVGVVTISFLCGFSTVFADGDEPPMYVSLGGADTGNCQLSNTPCESISYALRHVGKNGRILVAPGSYALDSPEDVLYLLSNAIDVRGGYYPNGSATNGAATNSTATLVGVPHEYANELAAKGFSIIADTKSLNASDKRQQQTLVKTRAVVQQNAALTVCSGGLAGVYPCDNVDLLSHVADRTPASRGADIWGFVDLNTQREYVIVSYSTGTAVFDVSDAENPREVGFVNGQPTTWRDIKVHQFFNAGENRWNAYAYVTADDTSDGLVIIDLTQLPHRIRQVSYASDFAGAHNIYISDVDFSTGLSISGNAPTLILAGANNSDGRFRSYSLADPSSPSFITTPTTPAGQAGNDRLYMHDAASMIVTDARKDSQCVNAAGASHCDVLFDFNEDTVDVWDVSNATNPVRLSQTPYANSRYVHSGWWSEDQQFLFVQDELDERDRGINTTLRVFSIADLTAPSLVGSWVGPTNAIDHNGFVRGNRYYMSNYTRGLTILDISNAAVPSIVGRFDTYPSSDSVGFPGNWGAYPYLPSGNIALSDIDTGLYMVADNTLDVAEGTLAFAATSFAADEAQALNLSVERTGGSLGAVSVNWEAIAATASSADIGVTRGTISWADGDAAAKLINLSPVNDGLSEGLERVMIRLLAPTGGATLSAPNIASAYVSDPAATVSIELSTTALSIAERGFGRAVLVAHRSGSGNGAVSVDYSIGNADAAAGSDYVGAASGTLTWSDGDATAKSIEFDIVDDAVAENDEFFELTLNNASGAEIGNNATVRVTILDGTGANNAPNSVAGSNQTVDSGSAVTLDGSASNDPNGDVLSYLWTQTTGTSVTLNSATSATADFAAPTVTSDTLLRFQLQVSDPGGQADTSSIAVTVVAPGSGGNSGGGNAGGGSGGGAAYWLLVILIAAGSRRAFNRKDAS